MPQRERDLFRNLPPQNERRQINPFVARLEEAERNGWPVLFGDGARVQGRNWHQLWPGRDLIVEVGAHKGHVLAQMAQDHPEAGFVGLDITFKRIWMIAARLQRLGLTNARSVLANARGFHDLFQPASVAGVVAFFPDPWLKKQRQQRNRLFSASYCADLAAAVRPGGWVWVKTDSPSYFSCLAAQMLAAGFRPWGCRPPGWTRDYPSVFQEIFRQQGESFESAVWLRAGPAPGVVE